MQLAAFNNNNFLLGHAAMLVNEGLPLYVVVRLEQRFDLARVTVGILGMAFKAGSDDIRSSLRYKLKPHPARSRRGRCCAPTRTSPSIASCCRSRRCWRASDLLVIADAAPRVPRPRHRQVRSSTSGTCRGEGTV